jgi:hypothetical protein
MLWLQINEEEGNIQEKSQLGTGTPDEFPRFPEISGLR